jgi:hypothetical protein
MKIVAAHQPQYLPYLGFFHKLAHCDIFVILDDVQFHKNGFQNRNKIKTSQGWQWITVPVLHRFGQTIKEVKINPTVRWQRKHLNAFSTNYSRTPYFRNYIENLTVIIDRQWENLCDLNMELMQWAMDILGLKTPIVCSSSLSVKGTNTERLVNLCLALGAHYYLSGPGGQNYMDISLFERNGIKVVWQQFSAPTYEQVFPKAGFIQNLSVVDALFCCGPETRKFLE